MRSRLTSLPEELFEAEKYSRLKIIFLSCAFFLIIAGYTLARELKSSIFAAVIGQDWAPTAKIMSLFVLMPAILLYSKLVDSMRRYQLLICYSAFFGIVGLLFAVLIGHPTIGIENTVSSPYRLMGWLFYFFVEGYSPFVVSVFWAFVTSVTSPEESKRNYGLIVSVSKLGGVLSAAFGWALFSWCDNLKTVMSAVALHQLVLGVSSCMLILVPVVIYLLIKKVPGRYLHGYEAAYQLEKQQAEALEDEQEKTQSEAGGEQQSSKDASLKEGVFSGLYMLVQYPYVLGIFGIVCFHEVMDTVISFLRVTIGQANTHDLAGLSAFLFQNIFVAHMLGMFISYFGTSALLIRLGERTCLLLVPILNGLLLLYFMLDGGPTAFLFVSAALKSIHYGFSLPVRESLYIPTVKKIRFKSKSWIDGFGGKFAKSTGSAFNTITARLGSACMLPIYAFFFASLVSCWFVTAFFLGRRFDRAVKKNEVIGAELD